MRRGCGSANTAVAVQVRRAHAGALSCLWLGVGCRALQLGCCLLSALPWLVWCPPASTHASARSASGVCPCRRNRLPSVYGSVAAMCEAMCVLTPGCHARAAWEGGGHGARAQLPCRRRMGRRWSRCSCPDAMQALHGEAVVTVLHHEVRSSLNSIIGLLELLKSGSVGPLTEKVGHWSCRAAWGRLQRMYAEVVGSRSVGPHTEKVWTACSGKGTGVLKVCAGDGRGGRAGWC
eukprot:366478-Chlamydomonas_euryale.AAC.3